MVNNKKFIIDTGPLVAFINSQDRYHGWIKQQFGHLQPPLLTCEAVISEAAFLLSRFPKGHETLLACLQRQLIKIAFRLEDETKAIQTLMARYSTVPMSLADACLVRMAEQHSDSVILTLDSDFHIYRKHGRQVIPTIFPELL